MKHQKKKIAFVLTTFVVGGLEKSFLSLLDHIDHSKYDITVFLPDDLGEWTPLLKEKCNVQYLKIESFRTLMRSHLKQKRFFELFRCLFFRTLARIHYKHAYRKSTEFFIRSMPRVKERFDCVAAYQIINDDCVLGSLYRLKAPQKVVWTHLDMNKTESLYGKWFGKFDRIFCVSKYSKTCFVKNFPMLESKAEVLYNTIPTDHILQQSGEPIDLKKSGNETILVTVARLATVKGQNIIPKVARMLLNAGYNIKWYLIGEGELREEIEKEIKLHQVDDHVVLLGSISNPYPYIKACDIYVQTSLVEGWGLTVSEAKVLAKPIVTTDAGVMSEQIQDGINGLLVPNADPHALAQAIARLIDNPELCDTLHKNLQAEDVSYVTELEKLYALIDAE